MKKFINVSILIISSIFISLSTNFISKANSWNKTDTGWEFISNGEVLKSTWLAETIPVGNKRTWYYLDSNGKMVTGWTTSGNGWYYLAQNGVMQTGWLQDNNNWYFLDSSGKMQVGWLYYNDNWYFLNAYGQMLTGWVLDNGKSYYLDKTSGYMLTSTTTPDGNQVDENGVYISNSNSSNSNKVSNTSQETFSSQAENEVLNLVNIEREKNGLAPLHLNQILVDGAKIRAKEIVTSFSHTRPDGSKPYTVFPGGDFAAYFNHVGENIAYGQLDAAEVMDGWMDSEGHRANILNPKFTSIGIGCYESGGILYWVQMFGREY